jgi:quercetin dioxygenase-like cupin family protein
VSAGAPPGQPFPGRPLTRFPVHLGLGATAVVQPEMSGPEATASQWYDAYATRNSGDGAEGRLVALHSFDADWTSWEMHPAGDELVVCIAGVMTLIQQLPEGREQRVRLGPGDYVVNPPGAWHTADVEGEATALFVTAGLGTQHRPR